jgi:hypothetical protein
MASRYLKISAYMLAVFETLKPLTVIRSLKLTNVKALSVANCLREQLTETNTNNTVWSSYI